MVAGLSARRRGGLVLAAAGVLLVGGWLTGLFRGPPVYDGLPLNSEPYRYLQAPPGFATTAPPASAAQSFSAATPAAGITQALTTSESPPQATVIYSTGAWVAPSGAVVRLSVAAVPLPALPPGGGHIDGNVYALTATSGGQPVSLAAGQSVTVALRATGQAGVPTLDSFAGGTWVPRPTTHVPPSIYSATVAALGDFVLVIPTGAAAAGGGGSGGPIGVVVAASAVVLLLAGAIAVIRRRRSD